MKPTEKYNVKTAPVSDEEIDFLAEIFTELIRKEEQHGDNDEKI
jgi:hypothetical protein